MVKTHGIPIFIVMSFLLAYLIDLYIVISNITLTSITAQLIMIIRMYTPFITVVIII